jgi:hypothetical protein
LSEKKNAECRGHVGQADAGNRVDQPELAQRAVVFNDEHIGHDHQLH